MCIINLENIFASFSILTIKGQNFGASYHGKKIKNNHMNDINEKQNNEIRIKQIPVNKGKRGIKCLWRLGRDI